MTEALIERAVIVLQKGKKGFNPVSLHCLCPVSIILTKACVHPSVFHNDRQFVALRKSLASRPEGFKFWASFEKTGIFEVHVNKSLVRFSNQIQRQMSELAELWKARIKPGISI